MAEQKFSIDRQDRELLTQQERIRRANKKERDRQRKVRRKMKQFAQ